MTHDTVLDYEQFMLIWGAFKEQSLLCGNI